MRIWQPQPRGCSNTLLFRAKPFSHLIPKSRLQQTSSFTLCRLPYSLFIYGPARQSTKTLVLGAIPMVRAGYISVQPQLLLSSIASIKTPDSRSLLHKSSAPTPTFAVLAIFPATRSPCRINQPTHPITAPRGSSPPKPQPIPVSSFFLPAPPFHPPPAARHTAIKLSSDFPIIKAILG